MSDLPEPLISSDVDLKDFPFTPIFRARLFGSGFHARATDAEWRAGVTLWIKSWDQVPAGSLPDDDIELCRLAELARELKVWKKLKIGAMRGWIKCSDGRLYHSVVAEGIHEAWSRKQLQRNRTRSATEARQKQRDVQRNNLSHDKRDNARDVQRDEERNVHQEKRREEKRIKEPPFVVPPASDRLPPPDGDGHTPLEKPKQLRGSRIDPHLDDGAIPDPWGDWAKEELGWPKETIINVAENFVDWWQAKAGAGGIKLDWFKTWKVWCRSEAQKLQEKAERNSRNGHKFEQKSSISLTASVAATPNDWESRVRKYYSSSKRFWMVNVWGPTPDDLHCEAPPEIIAKVKAERSSA